MKLVGIFWSDQKAYFFKHDQYIRWNVPAQRADDGYPAPISGNWKALTAAGWTAGIDAAVAWNNGKAYFFKGDKYIRVNLSDKSLDPGYPAPISGNWKALTAAGWTAGIDSAVAWNNGKAYFFKGDKYIRVNLSDKSLDPGYPAPIKGNWVGMFGGVFGDPDITISYRQPANFYVFDKDPTGQPHTTTTPGTTGMFMVYEIDTAVNHVDGAGLGSGPSFLYELSRVTVSMPAEKSGNTSLDPYVKEGPDKATIPGDESVFLIGDKVVIRVEGDSQALKQAKKNLHYRGPSGWSVAMKRNSQDNGPTFVDPMTPQIATNI